MSLYPANLDAILKQVKRVKKECVGKDIWLWTGYAIEQLIPQQINIVQYIDYLVDGKFKQQQVHQSLKSRGSRNQRIIAITKKLKLGESGFSINISQY